MPRFWPPEDIALRSPRRSRAPKYGPSPARYHAKKQKVRALNPPLLYAPSPPPPPRRLQVLCLAKEAICCLKSIVSCFKGCCDCCVSRICGGKSGEEGDEDGGRASAAGSAARGNVGQLMSLVVMIFSILTALIWEFYFAEGMDSQPGTRDPWCDPTHPPPTQAGAARSILLLPPTCRGRPY